jgi:helix-turn-helix protein
MRLACRLRELRTARRLSLGDIRNAVLAIEPDAKINRCDLSRLERGRLLAPDEWVPLLEQAYGAPLGEWYAPPAGAIVGVAIERDAG